PAAPSIARTPAEVEPPAALAAPPVSPTPQPASIARTPSPPAAPTGGPSEDKITAAGLSPFAAQWLFGDQSSATDDLVPMSVAEKMAEPTKEQRLARFLARGGLERSRGARIVEGAGTGPISPDELTAPEHPEAPSLKRLSTKPPTPSPSSEPTSSEPD